ncbi:O-antigen ligase family protein [Dyadobacter aurulentus]|uniref:O-antigen ligase family protein n=1 Tax=Dyadobacter sp. UC 10 TaxID=2605428 RepID=UPI001788A582|nr:O-antigen ligase family protein [Dyadobacter sp. UC 10]
MTNFALLVLIVVLTIQNRAKIGKYVLTPLFAIGFFSLILLLSFYRNPTSETGIILFKIILSFVIFYYGAIYDKNPSKLIFTIAKVSCAFIVFNMILSFTPYAYQRWGTITTFSGLYYFKTDMALALVVFLAFVLASDQMNIWLKIMSIVFAAYLVYLTNARIHILTIFIVIGCWLYGERLFINIKRKILYLVPIGIVGFISLVIILNSIGDDNILKIEISTGNVYNDANLQGRNQIWNVLISKYQAATTYDQLFGMGLNADATLTVGNLETNASHNAHNGYIFLLIATGFVGLSSFFVILWLFAKRFFLITDNYSTIIKERTTRIVVHPVLYLFFVNTLIFLVASLTNSAIMFQQQTWFFLFFAGYLFNFRFNSYLSKRKNEITHKRDLVNI